MNEIQVEIVRLDPMRLISAYGFGPEPEAAATEKMKNFLLNHQLWEPGTAWNTYGFNNPDPSPGSPNYGYEIWFPVNNTIEPEGDLRVIDFQGGLYAVTRFRNLNQIGQVWGALVQWRETSKYQIGSHQWLEKMLCAPDLPPEEYEFDLYLPIRE